MFSTAARFTHCVGEPAPSAVPNDGASGRSYSASSLRLWNAVNSTLSRSRNRPKSMPPSSSLVTSGRRFSLPSAFGTRPASS